MNFFKSEEQKTRKNINKILEICDLQRLKKIEQVLLTGVVQIDSLEVQEKPQIKYQEVEIDEAPVSATKEIMQKTKIDSPVWRYFLRDSTKKGVVSARISKITGGKKAVWKQSKNGNKDEYVAGIEGMKSDEVDKVMAQFKNLNTYFNKSAFRAKIWSRQ
tara:strand:+ start:45 stop:524 length:480 start_codon:yes stop_codon:yes gene_type:complete